MYDLTRATLGSVNTDQTTWKASSQHGTTVRPKPDMTSAQTRKQTQTAVSGFLTVSVCFLVWALIMSGFGRTVVPCWEDAFHVVWSVPLTDPNVAQVRSCTAFAVVCTLKRSFMDFRCQVWKRVWKMEYFGLILGKDLENRAAQPYQKLREVPPPPPPGFAFFPADFRAKERLLTVYTLSKHQPDEMKLLSVAFDVQPSTISVPLWWNQTDRQVFEVTVDIYHANQPSPRACINHFFISLEFTIHCVSKFLACRTGVIFFAFLRRKEESTCWKNANNNN